MDLIKTNDEVRYCTTCGAANKRSAVICSECKKKIMLKHSPFTDFIKKRIKDKFATDITESIFSLIKKFLLSHLYGVVLTVSVIATGTAVMTDTVSIINPGFSTSVTPSEVTDTQNEEDYTDFETNAIYASNDILITYCDHIYAKKYSYDGVTLDPATEPLSSIYAEYNVPGYNFPGVHEMMTKSIPLGIYDDPDPDGGPTTENMGVRTNSFVFNEDVETDLGKDLYEKGFDVMELIYDYAYFGRDVGIDAPPDTADELETYRLVFVRSNDDNWYLAEDRLIKRIEGESYAVYMQYGPYGYVTR